MTRIETDALVVRTVELGEADLVVTFVTEQVGKIAAIARGVRRGSRRTGGALEPVHTVAVTLEDRGAELATLKESRLVRVRQRVLESLDALDAAGVALRWARHALPPRTPEPRPWAILVDLLDRLDEGAASPRRELARAGLAMLSALGYALDLEGCVVCGKPCPSAKASCVDPGRGGLVCRACGGATEVILPEVRAAARALAGAEAADVPVRVAEAVLGLVERAMAAHAGFER